MENQDRGVWIRIRFVLRGRIRIRIRFVLRGWIRIRIVRIRSISDRIRNPENIRREILRKSESQGYCVQTDLNTNFALSRS